jgi:hypothetical protein
MEGAMISANAFMQATALMQRCTGARAVVVLWLDDEDTVGVNSTLHADLDPEQIPALLRLAAAQFNLDTCQIGRSE